MLTMCDFFFFYTNTSLFLLFQFGHTDVNYLFYFFWCELFKTAQASASAALQCDVTATDGRGDSFGPGNREFALNQSSDLPAVDQPIGGATEPTSVQFGLARGPLLLYPIIIGRFHWK